MTANHARANDVAALRRLVEPVRLKRHDALKILAHDEQTQSLLVHAIGTYQGVTSCAAALEVIRTQPEYQILCDTCCWSLAEICPECPKGCGCETSCTGWRHREYTDDSFEDELDNEYEYGEEYGEEYDDEPAY